MNPEEISKSGSETAPSASSVPEQILWSETTVVCGDTDSVCPSPPPVQITPIFDWPNCTLLRITGMYIKQALTPRTSLPYFQCRYRTSEREGAREVESEVMISNLLQMRKEGSQLGGSATEILKDFYDNHGGYEKYTQEMEQAYKNSNNVNKEKAKESKMELEEKEWVPEDMYETKESKMELVGEEEDRKTKEEVEGVSDAELLKGSGEKIRQVTVISRSVLVQDPVFPQIRARMGFEDASEGSFERLVWTDKEWALCELLGVHDIGAGVDTYSNGIRLKKPYAYCRFKTPDYVEKVGEIPLCFVACMKGGEGEATKDSKGAERILKRFYDTKGGYDKIMREVEQDYDDLEKLAEDIEKEDNISGDRGRSSAVTGPSDAMLSSLKKRLETTVVRQNGERIREIRLSEEEEVRIPWTHEEWALCELLHVDYLCAGMDILPTGERLKRPMAYCKFRTLDGTEKEGDVPLCYVVCMNGITEGGVGNAESILKHFYDTHGGYDESVRRIERDYVVLERHVEGMEAKGELPNRIIVNTWDKVEEKPAPARPSIPAEKTPTELAIARQTIASLDHREIMSIYRIKCFCGYRAWRDEKAKTWRCHSTLAKYGSAVKCDYKLTDGDLASMNQESWKRSKRETKRIGKEKGLYDRRSPRQYNAAVEKEKMAEEEKKKESKELDKASYVELSRMLRDIYHPHCKCKIQAHREHDNTWRCGRMALDREFYNAVYFCDFKVHDSELDSLLSNPRVKVWEQLASDKENLGNNNNNNNNNNSSSSSKSPSDLGPFVDKTQPKATYAEPPKPTAKRKSPSVDLSSSEETGGAKKKKAKSSTAASDTPSVKNSSLKYDPKDLGKPIQEAISVFRDKYGIKGDALVNGIKDTTGAAFVTSIYGAYKLFKVTRTMEKIAMDRFVEMKAKKSIELERANEKYEKARAELAESKERNSELARRLQKASDETEEAIAKEKDGMKKELDRKERDVARFQDIVGKRDMTIQSMATEATKLQRACDVATKEWEKVREEMSSGTYRKGTCVVCLDRDSNVLLTPCYHMNSCNECSAKLKVCPTCRRKITGKIIDVKVP